MSLSQSDDFIAPEVTFLYKLVHGEQPCCPCVRPPTTGLHGERTLPPKGPLSETTHDHPLTESIECIV
jgi:hypothetical protein